MCNQDLLIPFVLIQEKSVSSVVTQQKLSVFIIISIPKTVNYFLVLRVHLMSSKKCNVSEDDVFNTSAKILWLFYTKLEVSLCVRVTSSPTLSYGHHAYVCRVTVIHL